MSKYRINDGNVRWVKIDNDDNDDIDSLRTYKPNKNKKLDVGELYAEDDIEKGNEDIKDRGSNSKTLLHCIAIIAVVAMCWLVFSSI